MSKYRPLWEYISKYDKDKVILTYEEIDDILGLGELIILFLHSRKNCLSIVFQ